MTTFMLMQCGECGIEFQVPTPFYEERRKKGEALGWSCPNGHVRVFKETLEDQLRRERDSLKQQLAYKDDLIRAEQEQVRKVERAMAKVKRRAAAGVCPCCNRTFIALGRHMKTKHPDFTADPANVVPIKRATK